MDDPKRPSLPGKSHLRTEESSLVQLALPDPVDRLRLSEKEELILKLYDSLEELELEKQLINAQNGSFGTAPYHDLQSCS